MRETVRFLSTRIIENWRDLTLVREDWVESTAGARVV